MNDLMILVAKDARRSVLSSFAPPVHVPDIVVDVDIYSFITLFCDGGSYAANNLHWLKDVLRYV